MEPLEYLKMVQRRWRVLAAAVLVALVVTYVVTQFSPPERAAFTANHTLYRNPEQQQPTAIDVSTLALVATSGQIPQRVSQALDGRMTPAELSTIVEVVPNADLGTLTFTYTDTDGEWAAQVANAYAEEILAFHREHSQNREADEAGALAAKVESAEKKIRQLDQQLRELLPPPPPPGQEPEPESADAQLVRAERDALIREYGEDLQRLDELEARASPSSTLVSIQSAVPIPVVNDGIRLPSSLAPRMALATMLAIVVGFVLILLVERVDTKVRSRHGAEAAFGLPVIAEVPRLPHRTRDHVALAAMDEPASQFAEAHRTLRMALQLMPRWMLSQSRPGMAPATRPGRVTRKPVTAEAEEPGGQIVVVTSPGPTECKTTTAANLAATCAAAGSSVILIDLDLRAPELHVRVGARQVPGVAEFLSRRSRRPQLDWLLADTWVPGVRIIPGGEPSEDPSERLNLEDELLEFARAQADIVIVDTGPVLSVHDTVALLPKADSVIVVARSGHTSAEAAIRTSELLARVKATVTGVALVDVPKSGLATASYVKHAGNGGEEHIAHAVTSRTRGT